MNLRARLISGGLLIGLSQVATMGLSFARNLIVARTLSLEDMGIAATIALALAVLESASDMSVTQLIVQAKDGDNPRLLANAHTFMAIRGALTALILLVAGPPLAHLLKVPQAAWAFRLMAIAPLIRGFTHQDLWRYHRQMRFGPLAIAESVSQSIALIAAWPLAVCIGDYSVMLWVTLIQICTLVVCSHLLCEQPYCLRADREYVGRILHFGWPLLINGILILLLNYGDRAVIAVFPAYSMADVGLFMVAASVILMPTMLLCKLGATLLLPALAKSQDDPVRFDLQFQTLTGAVGVAAVVQTILLTIAGPSLTVLFFGEKYLPVASFFAWLSAASGVRVLRLGPTLAALALGDSRNPLIANIARCAGFAVAICAGILGAGLHWFAIAAFVGEMVSFIVSSVALFYRKRLHSSVTVAMTLVLILAFGLSMGVFEVVRGPEVTWIVPCCAALLMGMVAVIGVATFFEPVRVELRKLRTALCG